MTRIFHSPPEEVSESSGNPAVGKSTLAMTVMGLLEAKTTVTGSIRLDGSELTDNDGTATGRISLEAHRDRVSEQPRRTESRHDGRVRRSPKRSPATWRWIENPPTSVRASCSIWSVSKRNGFKPIRMNFLEA
jgi:energy-coupling factor transporter ATP-binding protein EcfA2